MRKKGFILCCGLLVCLATLSSAQTKVFEEADTAQYGVRMRTLWKNYPHVYQLFAGRTQAAENILLRSAKQFMLFRRQHDFARYKVELFLTEYYEPSGEAAYVLVTWRSATPDSTKRTVMNLLREHYQTKRLTTDFASRFSVSISYDGNLASKRKIVRKPGVINLIDLAQQTTRPDTVRVLQFGSLNLTAIPEVVYRFPNLTELDLSRNDIRTLPERLTANLPKLERLSLLYNALTNDSVFFSPNRHLKSLNMQGNDLTLLPGSVRNNRRLESLWVGNNMLKTADLRGLRRLTDLNLYNADLTALPPSLTSLRRLRVLDVYYNKLTELPARLNRLRRLEQLAVSHNRLRQLPARLARLRRLQVLYAHHNQIGSLPEEFGRFRRLRVLDLGYNYFSVTPPVLDRMGSLEELDLNSNNLQELSPGLVNLMNLKRLYLRNNPITSGQQKTTPSANTIRQLEARQTEVFH